MYKKLEIKDPCSQKWDEMTPMDSGRHCSSCNKLIHDFSNMNDRELLDMLQSGKYNCGMFTKDQMGTIYLEKEKTVSRKKYWSAIATSILAGTLQLSLSYGQTQTTIRKNAPVVDRSTMEKKFEEMAEPNNSGKQDNTLPPDDFQKKNDILIPFEFKVLDSESQKPIENVRVEFQGNIYTTDCFGKFLIQVNQTVDLYADYKIKVSYTGYDEDQMTIRLIHCTGVKILFIHKNRKKKEYMVLGQWG